MLQNDWTCSYKKHQPTTVKKGDKCPLCGRRETTSTQSAPMPFQPATRVRLTHTSYQSEVPFQSKATRMLPQDENSLTLSQVLRPVIKTCPNCGTKLHIATEVCSCGYAGPTDPQNIVSQPQKVVEPPIDTNALGEPQPVASLPLRRPRFWRRQLLHLIAICRFCQRWSFFVSAYIINLLVFWFYFGGSFTRIPNFGLFVGQINLRLIFGAVVFAICTLISLIGGFEEKWDITEDVEYTNAMWIGYTLSLFLLFLLTLRSTWLYLTILGNVLWWVVLLNKDVPIVQCWYEKPIEVKRWQQLVVLICTYVVVVLMLLLLAFFIG